MDIGSGLFLTLVAACAIAAALLSVLPGWRRLGSRLPVEDFIARGGVALLPLDALRAEVRCELCQAKPACRRLATAGAASPPSGCPNSELFAERQPL